MPPEIAQQLYHYLSKGLYTAPEIQRQLGCSQSTLSRLLSEHRSGIVHIGKARASRYTKARDIPGIGNYFPIYLVDSTGHAHPSGKLVATAEREFILLSDENKATHFEALPWFLADHYPDGFMGRSRARHLSRELGLPQESRSWNEQHLLIALVRRGEDLMGNLILGDESISRYLASTSTPLAPIPEHEIGSAYATLAENAMQGETPGSSAGGEQPKFTTLVERGGRPCHVLVKFSPPHTSEGGQRWADLLICEALALDILCETKRIPATQCTLVKASSRVFLEVRRFDRSGMLGRIPMVSLRAIDAAFHGQQDTWSSAADRMIRDGMLSQADAQTLRLLSVFGHLIGNTDQHFGNVSFFPENLVPRFRLAPAYDMLPMLYRPTDEGLPHARFAPNITTPLRNDEWEWLLSSAGQFWQTASTDKRISPAFRAICAENRSIVASLRDKPRVIR